MSHKLQATWDSKVSREVLEDALQTAHNYPGRDVITIQATVKGNLTAGDLSEIMGIADRTEAEVGLRVTITVSDGKQLRLFGPVVAAQQSAPPWVSSDGEILGEDILKRVN